MTVLPDGPASRGAATSWRVYLVWAGLWFGFSLWSKTNDFMDQGVWLPFAENGSLRRCQDSVGDGSGFDGGADVVGADDVGAGQDGGYVGGGSGVEAVFH
jgi:hypothetical protein